MKVHRSFLLTLLAVIAVPAVAAADNEKGPKVLGVDGVAVLPLGDYGDFADFAVGGLLRFELPLTPELGVSVRAGYIADVGTPAMVSTSYIPFYVGARYNVGSGGLFVAGEIGLTVLRASIGSASDSETKLGANVGAGYQKGKLSGRVSLWLPSLGDSGDAQGIMANVGIDILSL
ncbi:MAG: hypothetical protein IPL61_35920 [Myxococcales bacterium]|nr:hypothetical protein [Myxococcales bacterium]